MGRTVMGTTSAIMTMLSTITMIMITAMVNDGVSHLGPARS